MKKWTLVLGLFLLSSAAYAQGLPTFGSLEPGQVDTLNLQNLNELVSLPITSGTGRGLNLDFAATYNSNLWANAASKWTPSPSWGWNTNNMFGSVSYYSSTIRQCSVVVNGVLTWYYSTHYSLFGYTEPNGTSHSFHSIGYQYIPSQCTGSGYSGTFSANADDGSGYLLDGDIRTNMPVTNASGVLLTGKIKDSNGNFMSYTVPQSGEQDWSDSAGRTALKIITGTSSIQYQYQDTTGTYQTITLNLQTFNIKTNFACSGIVEYSGTASLPVSIVYPNGLQYSLSYEATPSNSGYITGRVSQITLPNGGYIQYQYGGSNDGMSCSTW